jgi:hypothetical protein
MREGDTERAGVKSLATEGESSVVAIELDSLVSESDQLNLAREIAYGMGNNPSWDKIPADQQARYLASALWVLEDGWVRT